MLFYMLDEKPFGLCWAHWIVQWWNRSKHWIRRFGLGPVFNLESKTQEDPVKQRNYKISQKKAILFPVINWIGPDEQEAKMEIDIVDPKQLAVSIDGQDDVGQHAQRVMIPNFKWGMHEGMSTDGYWIFIKPGLAKGRHMIDSHGHCRSGKVQIQIVYQLEIT